MAGDLVFSKGFLSVGFFFCCAVFAIELFADVTSFLLALEAS